MADKPGQSSKTSTLKFKHGTWSCEKKLNKQTSKNINLL